MTEEEEKQYEVIDGIVSFTPSVFKRKKSEELQSLENQLQQKDSLDDEEGKRLQAEIDRLRKKQQQQQEGQSTYYEQT